MDPTDVIKANSIVELLLEDNPAELERLRNRYPAERDLLMPGLQLGNRPAKIDACRDLAAAGLVSAEKQVPLILSSLSRRLSLAKKIRLLATLIASVSSAGIISSLALGKIGVGIFAAAVNFVASACTVYAQHLEAPLVGKGSSVTDLIQKAIKLEARVGEIRVMLIDAGADARKHVSVVKAVNELAAAIRSVQVFGEV